MKAATADRETLSLFYVPVDASRGYEDRPIAPADVDAVRVEQYVVVT